jgi:hypothetical protein
MLQAHSFLWHYLWVAPNVLLFILAVLIWRRKLHRQYLVWLIFAVVTGVEQLTLYATSLLRSVSPPTWWYLLWAGLLIEAVIKFALIGEIFGRLFGPYPSLSKLGKLLINGVGVVLLLLATVAAAYTPKINIYWYVSGAHLLEQTIFMIESGLIVFLFVFAAYFRLRWDRLSFGIALGLGISACVHLATWALKTTVGLSVYNGDLLNFLNMLTYHVCVLVWFYYFLVPGKVVSRPLDSPPPEHALELWNRELERLLHQ